MKNIKSIMLALVVVILLILPVSACTSSQPAPAQSTPSTIPTPSAPKTIELRWADHFAPTHDMAILAEHFAKMMTDRTGGRIKVTFYHAETLAKQAELTGLLRSGGCEVITCFAPGYPGEFNMYLGPNTPGVGIPNRTIGNNVRWELYYMGFFTDLDPYKVLSFYDVGVTNLFMRDRKITTIDELKGLKIKGSSASANKLLDALGATSISMPSTEEYMGLSRNMIDGLTTGYENFLGAKLYEVAKYCVRAPVNDGNMAPIMRKETWNNLPADIQAIIERIIPEYKYWLEQYFQKDGESTDLLRAKGVEVYYLSDAEMQKWTQAGSALVEKFITDNEAKGLPARKMMDQVKNILARYK